MRPRRVASFSLTNMYGSFFNQLFAEARRLKLVSGPVSYKSITASLQRGTVIFVYRPTRNKSIPFTTSKLSRKVYSSCWEKATETRNNPHLYQKGRSDTCSSCLILASHIIFVFSTPDKQDATPNCSVCGNLNPCLVHPSCILYSNGTQSSRTTTRQPTKKSIRRVKEYYCSFK